MGCRLIIFYLTMFFPALSWHVYLDPPSRADAKLTTNVSRGLATIYQVDNLPFISQLKLLGLVCDNGLHPFSYLAYASSPKILYLDIPIS